MEGNLAFLRERSSCREIVRLRMDSCEAKGIQTQSSSVNYSPCPVLLKLPWTFPSWVGASIVWTDRKLRGGAAIIMVRGCWDR